ncbi:hypothetical protein GCM10023116_07480 [Kistimonas scapharcae]|uniref:Ricin B lectin domain-containing protein n=2 Tax=Kistimonas scapharcae TaxID=1036133 RepID=A0ABP8UZ96_9GAMM
MLSKSNRNYLPVHLVLTALAVTSPLLVEATPLSVYGALTDFGNTLESLTHARTSSSLLYLNAANPVSEEQFSDIKSRMWTGDILLIDGTESEPQTVQAISASLGGVGLYGHVVMMYKPGFAPAQFKQIVSASAAGRDLTHDDTKEKLAYETLALHDRWARQLQYKSSQQRFGTSEWRPETTVQIELREINLPCLVGNQLEGSLSDPVYWTGGLIDACNHSASFSLNYAVDFIRSASALQGTEDAKYVRFTVNPESSGGAGWHLVDRPTHRHTWFQSWTNRTTWFGPIADYYRIEIHALDEDIRLSNSIPGSSPKHSKVKAKDTIKVGLPVRVGFSPRPAAPHQEVFPELPPGNDQEPPEAALPPPEARPQYPSENNREIPDADIPQPEMPAVAIVYPAADVQHSGEQNQQAPNKPTWQPGVMPMLVEEGSLSDTEENPIPSNDFASDDDNSIPEYDTSLMHGKPRSHLSDSTKHKHQLTHRHLSTVPAGSYYSSRSVTYLNHEYVIQNLSRSYKTDSAIWLWNREFSKSSGDWRYHEKCYIACTDWFFSDAEFSANAYSHFTPGFSATFKVPSDKIGHSIFKFVSTVNPVALAGHIRYQFLFQDYSLWDQKGEKHSIERWFRINWDSPVFSTLPTITVEASKQDSTRGLCLTVLENNTAEGAPVDIYKCHSNSNQYWQYDNKQQLRSMVTRDRCLTAESNNTLSVHPCSNMNQQKWQWQKNRLINLDLFYLTIKNGKATITKDTSKTNNISEWQPFLIQAPLNNTFTLEN